MQKEEGKMAIPAPIIELPQTPKLTNLMTTFCSPSSTPKIMQDTIHTLTHEIISAAKSHDQTLQPPTTMIPTLRGALTHVRSRAASPPCYFMHSSSLQQDKGHTGCGCGLARPTTVPAGV